MVNHGSTPRSAADAPPAFHSLLANDLWQGSPGKEPAPTPKLLHSMRTKAFRIQRMRGLFRIGAVPLRGAAVLRSSPEGGADPPAWRACSRSLAIASGRRRDNRYAGRFFGVLARPRGIQRIHCRKRDIHSGSTAASGCRDSIHCLQPKATARA
jgi:hypothetical protein